MRDGLPDPLLFEQPVGNLVRAHLLSTGRAGARGPAPGGLRAYGEMVAVLWGNGQVLAALALEELWNRLQRTADFAPTPPGSCWTARGRCSGSTPPTRWSPCCCAR